MKIKDVKAIQDLSYCVGQWGCYLICLISIAEQITGKEFDVLKEAAKLIEMGVVDYDWNRPKVYKNCMYVLDANIVLKHLGCDGYYIDKRDALPDGYNGYYVVRHTLEGNTHFTLPDYDPMTQNRVTTDGRITSYYLVQKRA